MDLPTKVGITGGIGAGKSTVATVFSELGIPVYNADERARFLTEHDEGIRAKVIAEFGADSYKGETYNRDHISDIVFHDRSKLEVLNSIIHPRVGEDFLNWYGQQSSSYVLKEAALLFEAGSYKQLDKIIVVESPLDLRIKRTLNRDHFRSLDELKGIINKQWTDEQRAELADYTIQNGHQDLLLPQVLKVHQELIS